MAVAVVQWLAATKLAPKLQEKSRPLVSEYEVHATSDPYVSWWYHVFQFVSLSRTAQTGGKRFGV